MNDPLIERQRLLDHLNLAMENLRHAMREKIRAQDQEDYWRKQVNTFTALLEQEQAD